jgi:protein-tyrosine phosphatase
MINVIFVCLGNICRSPMADGVFLKMVQDAGLIDKIHVDSAGTAGYHIGEEAHPGTLKVLKENEIPYSGRSRKFTGVDFDRFDYILAMDRSNYENILRLADVRNTDGVSSIQVEDGPEISLFLHFAAQEDQVDVIEVPDPYYTGGFDYVYTLVEQGSRSLLAHIREREGI